MLAIPLVRDANQWVGLLRMPAQSRFRSLPWCFIVPQCQASL